MRSLFLFLALLGSGFTGLSAPCFAAIYVPGQSVSGVSGDVFTWSESAGGSTYASWSQFATFPGGMAPGFLPSGASPSADASFDNGGSASLLTFDSNQSITSSGNAYGGLFGPGDSSTFVTDAFTTVRSGTSGGDYTRIVVQWDTLGSELDYSSILLSPSAGAAGTIAPGLAMETARTSLGGSFGGAGVSYLALWDIDASQAEYRVDFNAISSSMSTDNFRVDSFTQSTPFITPTAVPEPSSLAFLGLAIAGGMIHRRRKEKRNV